MTPRENARGGPPSEPGLLSIVIKAFNEEKKIARAIESALTAADELAPLRVEVVLADSLSSDNTVAVASRYTVNIVQLCHVQDRGCGAGVQLGYEWARGEWVYLMDGDMVLAPGFLPEALAQLQQDATLGGVGGAVVDLQLANGFDRIRINNRSGQGQGERPWLEGGGLYRRAAIERAGGYAANRHLLAYEEADLGLRVRHAGFRLLRLGRQAVGHEGHALGTWALMRRHWRSRRAMAAGMLLRMSAGQPWRWRVARMFIHPLATAAWWLLLPLGLVLPGLPAMPWLLAWLCLSALAVLLLGVVKRDPVHALVSISSWHYTLAAIVAGWFQPFQAPGTPIPAKLLQSTGNASRGSATP